MFCNGITKKGKQCKIKIKDKKYCKKHLNQSSILFDLSISNINNYFISLNPFDKIFFLKYLEKLDIIYSKKLMMNYTFNLIIEEDKFIRNYINNNKLSFNVINTIGDGNCGIHTIYNYLKNRYYINIQKIKFLMRYIDFEYKNKKWIEIIDIVKLLDLFNYGTVVKICDQKDIYLGFNIKSNYDDNCFINYINGNHFELLIPFLNKDIK